MNNEEIMNTKRTRRRDGRSFTGALLLLIGFVLLASKMGAPIPGWVFSWETFLILLGVFIGVKNRFHNPFWLLLIFVGAASIIDDAYPLMHLRNYIWPIAIMLMGLLFIIKPKRINRNRFEETNYDFPVADGASLENKVDITAVFSGVKRRILSKTFLGGDITAFMGGAEIDLTQADIQGTTVMDITAIFGGVKIIVPSDWDVQSHATAVFGGVDDKRYAYPGLQTNKVLVLDGVAAFGGIEIKSYPSATQPL
jgi:predicted membrane protein